MKIEIDLENKTVQVMSEELNLVQLMDEMQRMRPEDWGEFKVIPRIQIVENDMRGYDLPLSTPGTIPSGPPWHMTTTGGDMEWADLDKGLLTAHDTKANDLFDL